MAEAWTCGKGLAANAALPAAAGELMTAMAAVLEDHQRALDLTDPATRPEYHVYVTLAAEFRVAAVQLAAIAAHMRATADLPMGRHDEKAMSSAEAVAAFEGYVRAERELLTFVTTNLRQHEAMLEAMRR